MERETQSGRLTELVTNCDAFYLDPNAVVRPSDRTSFARSEYGTEVLSYPLVRSAFRDKRMSPRDVAYFEGLGATPLILEFLREGNLNSMDAAKHDRLRPVFVKAMAPRRVEEFRRDMRRIGNELIDNFIDAGECDLVADFAHIFPISVMAQFIGVPGEDVGEFADATMQLRMLGQMPFEPGIPKLEGALLFLRDYIGRLVDARRIALGDTLVDALIRMQMEDKAQLSDAELVWGLAFLLLAGHDTTRFTLAGCIHNLIDADYWEMLARSPDRAPAFVVESMRFRPGTPRQIRVVKEPFEMCEHNFVKGEVVSLNLCAAGRDPEAFADVMTFDIDRSPPSYDVGFGYGRYFCVGNALAKAEMAEAIVMLTSRLTGLEFTGQCALKPTGVIGGFDSLPVRFERRVG